VELVSGQEMIYRGHFGAARLFFEHLARVYPADPAAPTLEASALIWWAEAREEDDFQADTIDALLDDAIARARMASDSAMDLPARARALFWLGSAYGYRAREAELRGDAWRAARDAKSMRGALQGALEIDSTCVDCLLGLGVYDYALARASALARFVARLIGLGGGNAERALERMRKVAAEGDLTRTEARWVYASALLREGVKDPARLQEGLRIVGDLALQFPENPVFQRSLDAGGAPR